MKVHRFPRTRFETWRTNSAEQLWAQAGKWMPCMPIQIPVILSIHYWPSDARVRDLDGMLSAIGHLLEWTRIVEHDGQIMEVEWHRYASDSDASGIVLVVEPYVADARPSVNLMQLRKSHTMDVKALQELFAARGFRTTHAEALSRVLSTACPSTSHALG